MSNIMAANITESQSCRASPEIFDQDKESEWEGPKKYYRNQRCGRMERTLLKCFGLSFVH